jgi:hypothetical protein
VDRIEKNIDSYSGPFFSVIMLRTKVSLGFSISALISAFWRISNI